MGQGLRSDERKVQAGGVPMLLESKYRVNAGLKMNYLTFYLIVNKLLSLSLSLSLRRPRRTSARSEIGCDSLGCGVTNT